jgi:hypothetical protein
MIPATLCLAVVGFVCGLLVLHWVAVALLSTLASVVFLLVASWDVMLLPKWLGLMTALQLAYLAGAALRLGREDRPRIGQACDESREGLDGEKVLNVEDKPSPGSEKSSRKPSGRGSLA